MPMQQHDENKAQHEGGESGQASVLLILMLSTFMLAVLGFAVDLSGMWFHRQALQSAADAACLAGASDMMATAVGSPPPSPGFTAGTNSNCATSSSASICKYAGFNGYAGAGLNANTASNSVSWTFSNTASGATTPTGVTNAFLQVNIVENVKTFFMGLVGKNYQQVAASATCGLASVLTAPPIVILDPSASGSLYVQGNPTVAVIGGPSRSIIVDSTSTTAAQGTGTKIAVDTSKAGPNGTGGDIAIAGAEPSAPKNYGLGNGNWIPSAFKFPDPFANVAAPSPIPTTAAPTPTPAPYPHDACPDTSGCQEYVPGYYPGGIQVKGFTGIFQPGIYILDNDFTVDAGGVVRNAYVGLTKANQTTDGVMFYMRKGAVNVTSSSGKNVADTVPVSMLSCNGLVPSGLPTTNLNGSILNAQCTDDGTYSGLGGTGTLSSSGSRGLLFFEAHTNTSSPAYNSQGGGAFLLSGTEYFHSTASPGIMSYQGNPSGTTYLLGYIVTDQLYAAGNAALSMVLNSLKTITTYKIALVQ